LIYTGKALTKPYSDELKIELMYKKESGFYTESINLEPSVESIEISHPHLVYSEGQNVAIQTRSFNKENVLIESFSSGKEPVIKYGLSNDTEYKKNAKPLENGLLKPL